MSNYEKKLSKLHKESMTLKEKVGLEKGKNFIACDIETVKINDVHVPYAAAFIDQHGIKKHNIINSKLSMNDEKLDIVGDHIISIFETVLKSTKGPKKWNLKRNKNIYAYYHNLDFDGVFILKSLLDKKKVENWLYNNLDEKYDFSVKIKKRDNKLIEIKIYAHVTRAGKKDNIFFISIRDSIKLLPASLNKLAKQFLGREKIVFDHTIVDTSWLSDMKNQQKALKYLLIDCELLMDVLKIARKEFNKTCNVDILNHLTISSLTLETFRVNYLVKVYLGLLGKKGDFKKRLLKFPNKNASNFIRESYKGGLVEVFKPQFKHYDIKDKLLYHYDVNSLYPHIMKYDLPVGYATFTNLKGQSINKLERPGFIRAIVTVSENILPSLSVKHKFDNGESRLITPRGRFTGVWYTEELKYAKSLGTKIEMINGYMFETSYPVFKTFVEELYTERLKAKKNKNDILNNVYKLLLNSLYGRLGMRSDLPETVIVPTNMCDLIASYFTTESVDVFDRKSIISIINNQNHKKLAGDHFSITEQIEIDNIHSMLRMKRKNYGKNTAIHCASAITALARIELLKIIHKNMNSIYYCDTDSIFTTSQLNQECISQTVIGKWKLENKIKEAYFINPKTYGFINDKDEKIVKAKGALFQKIDFEFIKQSYEKINEIKHDTNLIKIHFNFQKSWKNLKVYQSTKDFTMQIKETEKRKKVFNNENLWVDTKPLILRFNKSKNKNELVENMCAVEN